MSFMADDIVEVDPKTETISCDGGEDGLGHPAVYYTFNNENKIVCGYCGKTFIKKKSRNVQRVLGFKKNMSNV